MGFFARIFSLTCNSRVSYWCIILASTVARIVEIILHQCIISKSTICKIKFASESYINICYVCHKVYCTVMDYKCYVRAWMVSDASPSRLHFLEHSWVVSCILNNMGCRHHCHCISLTPIPLNAILWQYFTTVHCTVGCSTWYFSLLRSVVVFGEGAIWLAVIGKFLKVSKESMLNI